MTQAHRSQTPPQTDRKTPAPSRLSSTAGHVNAHTHLYSGLAGLGLPAPSEPPQSFLQILQRIWWRLDRALDARSLRAAARLYVAEALLAGTTALIDHHESPCAIAGSLDVLADACESLGMRALLCYGASERNHGADEGAAGLAECERFLCAGRRRLVRGLVGLHASFTVSDRTIAAAARLCQAQGVPLHVHVAEDACDVADAQARGEPGPLERLARLGALPAGSILAHGVHLRPDQVQQAEALGLWLVHNPRSNHNNRVGYAQALRHSRRVALGSDGFPSDMAQEVAALRQHGTAYGDDDAVAQARLQAGHAILRQHFADDDLAGDEVQRDAAGRLQSVRVAGRLVVENGALLSDDLPMIRATAAEEAERLWQRMRDLPAASP